MKIEFWFDFGSTYSYPTAMRIESLAEKHHADILWRPFLLGAVFSRLGWNDSPFNIYPVKGAYMWKDIKRVCDDLQIPFNRPEIFPQNGLLAARVATWFDSSPWVAEFIRNVFSANFEKCQDISSTEVISDCLACSGQDVAAIIAQATLQESKDLLRKRTDEAHQRGIFGAPSFFVDDELFWGNDRLESAFKWGNKSRSVE